MYPLMAPGVLLLATAAAVGALPTATPWSNATRTVPLTGVTHSVVAGLGGLRFDPDNVVADVGDVVEWHFLARNHSVARSSFAEPCRPLAGAPAFFAGFNFATRDAQARGGFQVVVKDKEPIWYYCPQQSGSHCQNGMVGVINQASNNTNSSRVLGRHRQLAADAEGSAPPLSQRGGSVVANPHPLGGF